MEGERLKRRIDLCRLVSLQMKTSGAKLFLCALCVSVVQFFFYERQKRNHRDTEGTEERRVVVLFLCPLRFNLLLSDGRTGLTPRRQGAKGVPTAVYAA
jgi:hypothetical protein